MGMVMESRKKLKRRKINTWSCEGMGKSMIILIRIIWGLRNMIEISKYLWQYESKKINEAETETTYSKANFREI